MRAAAALLASLLLLLPRPADGAARRKVAVLEYRAGVTAVPALAERIAIRLLKTSALNIVDPPEARRRFAPVDAEVGRCNGEPQCLARVGVALDVDEVLLVAMSQLGDLVLTLQRVDVDQVKVVARLAEVLALDAEISEEHLDRWLHTLYPPEAFLRYGFLMVSSNVEGAAVSLNGRHQGLTPLERVQLAAPQRYQVDVGKPGYLPFAARVDLAPDSAFEVRANLVPEPEYVPWYKRWYPWAIVGAVAVGAVVGIAVWATYPDDSRSAGYVILPQ